MIQRVCGQVENIVIRSGKPLFSMVASPRRRRFGPASARRYGPCFCSRHCLDPIGGGGHQSNLFYYSILEITHGYLLKIVYLM